MTCRRLAIGLLIAVSPVAAQQRSTNPADFVSVKERVVHSNPRLLDTKPKTEIDDRSSIQIVFDQSRMAEPAPTVPNGPVSQRVTVRVEVFAFKGSAKTVLSPIANYVESPPTTGGTPAGAPAGTTVSSAIVNHDHMFNLAVNSLVPNTEFDLADLGAADADKIEVLITNVETREQLIVSLIPRQFGLRPKVSDTVMFMRRLGISKTDEANGVSAVNFAPSPGVTYGGTYYARNNTLIRFLQPGLGITVLFTKWDNPAFDVSTGQFVPGTKSSDIQTALGGQLSLFSNVIQVGYGANLQVDQKRQYFSVGLSFVNLVSKISGLLGK